MTERPALPIGRLCMVAAACCILGCVAASAEGNGGSTDRLVPVGAVFHAADAHDFERLAAKLVADYLGQGGQTPIPVQELPADKDGKNAVIIGKAAVSLGLVSKDDLEWCGREGFVLDCRDERVVIAGSTPVAAPYAAQSFVERQTRLRPDLGREARGQRVIPDVHRERPFFLVRRLYRFPDYRYRYQALPDPRNGANPELFADSDLFIDHTAGYLVPRKLYFGDHPEYFALRSGKRTAGGDIGIHLCLSNPAVTRISIERMDAWMRLNPEFTLFPVASGDWSMFCQCDRCHKLDPRGVPDISYDMCTRELHWVNGVARAMADRHPDKLLLTFAYAATSVPPPVIRPEKNVWVSLAIWRSGYPLFFDHVMAQKPEVLLEGEGAKLLDRWVKILPDRLCVFEYPPNVYEPAMLENTAARIRFLARRGVRGISICYGNPAKEDFAGLFHRVYSRLLWNPDVDVYAEAEDCLRSEFGPGGTHLMKYFELCRGRYRETLADRAPLGSDLWPAGFYSEPFVDTAVAAFDAAAAANSGVSALKNAVLSKKCDFLFQILFHLPRDAAGKTDPKRVTGLLTQLSQLAHELKREKDFMRLAGMAAPALEKQVPGCGQMVLDWVNNWHQEWLREMMQGINPATDGFLEGTQ